MQHFQDKYGKSHPTQKEADFANICYDMMKYLTENLNFTIQSAEDLVAELISSKQNGEVARAKFRAFCQLVDIHHERQRDIKRGYRHPDHL